MGRSWVILLLHVIVLFPGIKSASASVLVRNHGLLPFKVHAQVKSVSPSNAGSMIYYRIYSILNFENQSQAELNQIRTTDPFISSQPHVNFDSFMKRDSLSAYKARSDEHRILVVTQEQVNQQQKGKTENAPQQTGKKPAAQKPQTATPLAPTGKTFKPGYNKPTYTTPKKSSTSTATPKKSSKINPGTRQNFNRTYTPKRVTPAKAIKTIKSSTTTKQSTGSETGSTNK